MHNRYSKKLTVFPEAILGILPLTAIPTFVAGVCAEHIQSRSDIPSWFSNFPIQNTPPATIPSSYAALYSWRAPGVPCMHGITSQTRCTKVHYSLTSQKCIFEQLGDNILPTVCKRAPTTTPYCLLTATDTSPNRSSVPSGLVRMASSWAGFTLIL